MIEIAINLDDPTTMMGDLLVGTGCVVTISSGADAYSFDITFGGGDQPRANYLRSPYLVGVQISGDGAMKFAPVFVAVIGASNIMFGAAVEALTDGGRLLHYKCERRPPDTRLCVTIESAAGQTIQDKRWFLASGSGMDGSLVTLGFAQDQLVTLANFVHQACSVEERISLAKWLLGHSQLSQPPGGGEAVRAMYPAEGVEVGKTWDGQVAVGFMLEGGGQATFLVAPELVPVLRDGLANIETMNPLGAPPPPGSLN